MSTLINRASVHDIYRTYTEDSNEFREGRVPEIGASMEFTDGRSYLFCKTRTALSAGDPVGALNSSAAFLAGSTSSVGTNTIATTSTAGLNQYAGFTLFLPTGQTYIVASNTKGPNSVLTLEGRLTEAVTSGSLIWREDAAEWYVNKAWDEVPIGLAVVAVPASVSETYYLWVQTSGGASVRVDDDTGMSEGVGLSVASGNVVLTTGTKYAFARSKMKDEDLRGGANAIPALLTLPKLR